MAELKWALVPINIIPVIWAQCYEHIKVATDLSQGCSSPETIYDKVMEGHANLGAVMDGSEVIAVVILELTVCETGHQFLYLSHVGGSRLDEWYEGCMEFIKPIALAQGCTEIRGTMARRGWMRVLKKTNWTECYTVMKLVIQEK